MAFKEFVKKNKKKLIIIGGTVVTAATAYLLIKHGKAPEHLMELGEDLKVTLGSGKDIPIPEIGKDLGIYEYFQEDKHLRCMFTETFAWKLGDLGQALIDEFEANPDLPMAITLEYVSN